MRKHIFVCYKGTSSRYNTTFDALHHQLALTIHPLGQHFTPILYGSGDFERTTTCSWSFPGLPGILSVIAFHLLLLLFEAVATSDAPVELLRRFSIEGARSPAATPLPLVTDSEWSPSSSIRARSVCLHALIHP